MSELVGNPEDRFCHGTACLYGKLGHVSYWQYCCYYRNKSLGAVVVTRLVNQWLQV